MAYYFDWSVSWDDEEGFGGAGETKIFSPKDFDKAQKLQREGSSLKTFAQKTSNKNFFLFSVI
jgi:hypothetical protein